MDKFGRETIRSNYSVASYTAKTQNWWKEFMDVDTRNRSSGGRSPAQRMLFDDDDSCDVSESHSDDRDRSPVASSSSSSSFSRSQPPEKLLEMDGWLGDTNHGFMRVYDPNSHAMKSRCLPCSLGTTCHQICLKLGIQSNALHLQYNGDVIRRLEPYDHPLALQNEYLSKIGYSDICRIQEVGQSKELGYLIRFYAGKPIQDGTFSRRMLSAQLYVRKGKVFHQWVKRLVVVSGTRVLIYPGAEKKGTPQALLLAKGRVEEVKFKNHSRCLRLTSALQAGRTIYLSFPNDSDLSKWLRKITKAVAKQPNLADLSNNHLEYIPENLFVNDRLSRLNLRHNALKERPIEEDIYTIGWVDDLPSFQNLHTLNMSDNDLYTFPSAICQCTPLQELNISGNKIEEIPPIIAELSNAICQCTPLQELNISGNKIEEIPPIIAELSNGFIQQGVDVSGFIQKGVDVSGFIQQGVDVSGFIQQGVDVSGFIQQGVDVSGIIQQGVDVSGFIQQGVDVENIEMTGNYVERLPGDTVSGIKHIKQLDVRLNCLTLPPVETITFELFEHLTHLDVRHNNVTNLDLRSLPALLHLNCERNRLVLLQLNGTCLHRLLAAHNSLQALYVTPLPENLKLLDVSHNELNKLPDWVCDLYKLESLRASHNRLSLLPNRLLCHMEALRMLYVDHNQLTMLPECVESCAIEVLMLEHNRLTQLPVELLVNCRKLKTLNATNNRLTSFPPLNQCEDLNKIQELNLSFNYLTDAVFEEICNYPRLKILHMAYNCLREITAVAIHKLEILEELNISGNKIAYLPDVIGELPKLVVLRAHSNKLRALPDFYKATSLKVLDVGCNQLHKVSVSNIMASQLKHLDVSCNSGLQVTPQAFQSFSSVKNISLVDMNGSRNSRSTLTPAESQATVAHDNLWNVGFSETSGSRNKLCITQLRIPQYGADEALFGIFDGGRNNEAPLLLQEKVANIMRDELNHQRTSEQYMKYTMLTAHRKLKGTGQRIGAATCLCHLRTSVVDNIHEYIASVASVGNVEAVLCRSGELLRLTRLFTVVSDQEECDRVKRNDAIITDDNKVNGNTDATRMLGCGYLFPAVIPDPHIITTKLRADDEFIIVANCGLWKYVSYVDAIQQIRHVANPVLAAKKLQDLAQSYGSKENLSIMVIQLNLEGGNRHRYTKSQNESFSTVHTSSLSSVPASARNPLVKMRHSRTASDSQHCYGSSNQSLVENGVRPRRNDNRVRVAVAGETCTDSTASLAQKITRSVEQLEADDDDVDDDGDDSRGYADDNDDDDGGGREDGRRPTRSFPATPTDYLAYMYHQHQLLLDSDTARDDVLVLPSRLNKSRRSTTSSRSMHSNGNRDDYAYEPVPTTDDGDSAIGSQRVPSTRPQSARNYRNECCDSWEFLNDTNTMNGYDDNDDDDDGGAGINAQPNGAAPLSNGMQRSSSSSSAINRLVVRRSRHSLMDSAEAPIGVVYANGDSGDIVELV
ncbi:PREDICTED: PH domain leucine-rich repeat-containing protein phosphatase 2-like [Priapulus caudatus]|uniref:PH domain leucine-rich repeat-containing protein phosphatase 2-like n=1 Tax=Priapulus caudatus TaxID=37621 RepID=A0ABM1EBE5_PRICU|nr:PREDICTED: PH domain leucine-rich repeat-containing protein phosphatase 2-like [Priapulus caudatus]